MARVEIPSWRSAVERGAPAPRKHQGKKGQSAHAQPPLMPELTQRQGHWEAKAMVQVRHDHKPIQGDGELEQHPGTACVQVGPDGAPEKKCRLADYPFGAQAQKLTQQLQKCLN